MVEVVFALLLIVDNKITEHRIQDSLSQCLKAKRYAMRDKSPKDRVNYQCIKSKANMLGYFGRPDLTSKTIQDGWMWTGDIATWDSEGYCYIVDRAKDMIISGGENINSIQVEEAIAKNEGVLEVAVIGVPDDEWGESVKAFVVSKPGFSLTSEDIVATASKNLASYQKPKFVEFVSELPKAPTGKILKRNLRNQM